MTILRPQILFLCVHNAGRSQMAAGFARQLGGDRVLVHSAGSDPACSLNPSVIQVMAERGIDIADEAPHMIDDALARTADVIVTMGCGDACPFYPGKRYVDWDLADPQGMAIDEVRKIRDDIEVRVRKLIEDLLADR